MNEASGSSAIAPDGELRGVERDVTMALIVLNVFLFLVEPRARDHAHAFFEQRYSLSAAGLKAGYWWQFFTFQFLHGNWLHLGTNLVLLHSMGPVLETTLGRRRYLLLYIGSGALGGLVHAGAAFAWPAHFGQPVVGASAGLCGLLAAVGYLYADDKVKGLFLFVIPFEIKAKVLLLLAGVVSMVGTVLPLRTCGPLCAPWGIGGRLVDVAADAGQGDALGGGQGDGKGGRCRLGRCTRRSHGRCRDTGRQGGGDRRRHLWPWPVGRSGLRG